MFSSDWPSALTPRNAATMPPAIISAGTQEVPGAMPVMSPLADALSISLPNTAGR